jgi:hypothetical protein
MKRCPECEFLYENESTKCDMDGTPLRFTATLPALPGFTRTVCDKWTITLVALLVLGTVLVILYRATPRAYTSSTPTHVRPAERQSPESLEPTASPSDSSSLQLDDSDNSSDSTDSSGPLLAANASNSRKSKRSGSPADDKEQTPTSVTHVDAASSAQNASNAAIQPVTIQTSKDTPKPPAVSTNSISIHPLPPETTPNKASSQNEKKDSGVKSFFKKAGKVLKKPFGEN